MGWTYLERPRNMRDRDFFQHEVFGQDLHIVADATIEGVYYAALRTMWRHNNYTFAVVILTDRHGKRPFWFGYKELSESTGPCYIDCPAEVLNALTPLEEIERMTGHRWEYAATWREKCRARLAEQVA